MSERLFDFGVSFPEQTRLIQEVTALDSEAEQSVSQSRGRSSERRAEQAKSEPEAEKPKVVFTKRANKSRQVQEHKRR